MSRAGRGRPAGPGFAARRSPPSAQKSRRGGGPPAAPRVAVVACPSYEPGVVAAALEEGLARLGGVGAFVPRGGRALLKINLLGPRGADEAVTTHPEVTHALAAALAAARVAAVIGDSPGVGDFDQAAAIAGLREVYARTGAQLVELRRACKVAVPAPLRTPSFQLYDQLGDFDLVVDVPKLKSHAFQVMTCAVKNLFGLVPGRRKEAFHRLLPEPDAFGEMLLDLCRTVRPGLVVVDAVEVPLADRPGARGGKQRLGLLVCADDAVAADAVLAEIVGIGAANVPVLRAARRLGLPGADPAAVTLVGGLPPGVTLRGAAAAVAPARGYPASDAELCNACGTCAAMCPVDAIRMADGRPVFDEEQCIRCYCCQEFCETAAITVPGEAAPPPPPTPTLTLTLTPPTPSASASAKRWRGLTVVLPPAFGLRGSRISLGLAYLQGALRAGGLGPTFADLNAACEAEEPELFAELDRRALPDPGGGLHAPDLELLLQTIHPEAFATPAPLAAAVARSAAVRARDLGPGPHLVAAHDGTLLYAAALGAALTRAGAAVVLGGPAVTMHAAVRDLLLRTGCARALFCGEADDVAAALGRALGAGARPAELAALPGVVVQAGAPCPPVARAQLDGPPYPDFGGMTVGTWLPVQASRGCPHRCSFCAERAAVPRYRRRTPEDVVGEMERAAALHGVRAFEFNDDLLNADTEWLVALTDALRGRGLEWAGFLEPWPMPEEVWAKLAAAGCRGLTFGVQSFSPPLLKRMGRRADLGVIRRALLGAARAGIPVQFDVIVGHPGESEEEFGATLAAVDGLLAEEPALMVNLNAFQMVPGSDVAERPERYGLVVAPPELELPPALAHLADLVPRFYGAARLEPGRGEVEARSSLLAEVVYRHKAPLPVPILDEELPACNNNCVFCGVADLRSRARVAPLAEVEAGLAAIARSGEDRVMFAVSELSLRPDFVPILEAARRRGFRAIYVVTNGRMFAYRQFAERAVAAGATHFLVSLHGPDAERHEALTRTPGSFGQTVAGIRNLAELGAQVCTNTVVCRRNLAVLDAIVDLAGDLGARWVTLSQVQIIGDAARYAERLVVPLGQAAPRMLAAALHGERRGLRMGLGGVPYCLVPEHGRFLGVDDLSSMYNADPRDSITEKAPYVRPAVCFGCASYAVCNGLPEEYLKRYGSGELRPLAGRRETVRPPGEAVDFIVPRGGAAAAEPARAGIGGRAPAP
jgi:uncharacterized protein (DUF362 family)/radical SAM superfamily enzyme YgiQ (UPF0313 family)/NAD-dependent dihydropyrimidine dehydrogenase PreA subunit